MATTTPLTDAINSLTTYSNSVTGASDTDLSSAVATLVAGYGGGGTSNFVTGTFTGASGGALNIDTGYSGNGYPIFTVIYPSEGTRASHSDGAYYNLVHSHAVNTLVSVKNDFLYAPSFSGSAKGDLANVLMSYKNSSSDKTSYGVYAQHYAYPYSVFQAMSGQNNFFRYYMNARTLSVFIIDSSSSSSAWGYYAGIPFTYHILYSE